MMTSLPDLAPALPELLLAGSALLLLLMGVISQGQEDADGRVARVITLLAVLVLLGSLALIGLGPHGTNVTFSGLFVTDRFTAYAKILVLLGASGALLLSVHYNENQGIGRFEYPVLILFSVCGMLAMISAGDLLSLYIGLELQSLPLYVLAAFRTHDSRSTEAGLKYFVLGALSSGMLLFGASILYGFAGSTNFHDIAHVLSADGASQNMGALLGLVFLMVGLAFKCSAVPFHMWTPDVYEGAPTSVTAFFATAPKMAALALFARVLMGPAAGLIQDWGQIVWFLSAASMILGAYGAMTQTNIKRLLAYSSIGHVGFALMGVAAGTEEGLRGLLVYLTVYLFMSLAAFGVLVGLGRGKLMVENISDLSGLSKNRPRLAFAMAVVMMSMAGLPPFAGIFGKILVFLPALHAGLYGLTLIGALSSVLAFFYYLRLVKVMYLDPPAPALDYEMGFSARGVLGLSTLVIMFFVLAASPVLAAAGAAAHALFPG